MNSSPPRINITEGSFFNTKVSAPVIDPAQPHTFSPHLRWTERPDGTFVLEMCETTINYPELPPNPGIGDHIAQLRGMTTTKEWQEVALWREPGQSMETPSEAERCTHRNPWMTQCIRPAGHPGRHQISPAVDVPPYNMKQTGNKEL